LTTRIAGAITAVGIVTMCALPAEAVPIGARPVSEAPVMALIAIGAVVLIVRQVRRLRRPRAGA
jgi:hypothetical protein